VMVEFVYAKIEDAIKSMVFIDCCIFYCHFL
jgi:hypothetical protein